MQAQVHKSRNRKKKKESRREIGKNTQNSGLGIRFFSKEHSVLSVLSILSVLFRSFIKNVQFFSVLYKRTFRSFPSFSFFIKERNVLFTFFLSS